ncbi:uncharacterized protein LOC122274525 [Carya illinoinensis]|uniref:uncharacterized protein LOC122274525 n=1 Tax=Carya illinoinensis TaxID=32201 RepID=UPI001C726CFF|nr:uncharacterized protein LOC122274525 [Carya illinoinensis]
MEIRESKGKVRSEGVVFEEIPVEVHEGDEKSGGRVDTELKGHESDVQEEGLNSAVISIEHSAVIPEVNLEVEKIDEEEVQDKGTQVEKKKCWKRRVRGRGQVSQVCSLNLNSKRAKSEEDVEMLLLGGGKKARLNEGAEPVYNLCEVEAVEQPHLPNVVFLMETKMNGGKVEMLKGKLQMEGCVASKGEVKEWFFTGFYGHPDVRKRSMSWDLLNKLRPTNQGAWCVAGDFNEILIQAEKSGGNLRSEGQMAQFREVLENNNLSDLGCCSGFFTWSNRHSNTTFTKERLDRYVANTQWRELFRGIKVEGLTGRCSDHLPILLTVMGKEEKHDGKRKFPFRFEASWIKEDKCEQLVRQGWYRKGVMEDPIRRVSARLETCKGGLNTEELRNLQDKVGLLLEQEDLKWKQRAKRNWYCLGDKNTKFFHACANQRKKKNQILSVVDSNSNLRVNQEGIAEAFKDHFSEIYRTAVPSSSSIEACLSAVKSKVTDEMNQFLLKTFTREEVVEAVRLMGPLKSPRPDGYGACFFQSYWDIVGKDVCEAALKFLNGGGMDKGLNHTFIALIPKVKKPESVNDFRPISLCNVMYKIIAKTLANRLKKVLGDVISRTQSAFVPQRLITDNIITAYEVLHSMQTRQKDRVGSMALKLDISKAYDKVEWVFLEKIMEKLRFCERWVALIMECVSTVSYAILTNGSPGEKFKPTRGLRQGDPLSPYLFLLCAEGLSAMLQSAEETRELKGVAVARGGTKVTHLLFADDCIIFGKASWSEWRKIMSILEFPNAKKNAKEGVLKELGARLVTSCEKYLGLPIMVGRSKYDSFRSIKDRIWQRVNNWKHKFLFPTGKEVLLKAAIQAVPNYHMNVFRLPRKLCKEIVAVMEKFWWGFKENERKIQWKSWSKMGGLSKADGGLGFRELESFNTALLAKQCWRIFTDPHSLAARVLKDKYFRHSDFLQANLGHRPSLIWKSLWSSLGLLKHGLVWRVGTGQKIKVWGDRWIPTLTSHSIRSPVAVLNNEARVNELIDSSRGAWKEELVKEVLNENEAMVVCNLPISKSGLPDKQIWGYTKDGFFSVKSAYHLEVSRKRREKGESSEGHSFNWKKLWGLNVPRVVKVFLWKALNDCLPTRTNLKKRKVVKDACCPIYETEDESITHALWSCRGSMDVWADKKSPLHKWSSNEVQFYELWERLSALVAKEELELVVVVMRGVWFRRNAFIFENKFTDPGTIVEQAAISLENFQTSQTIKKGGMGSNGKGRQGCKWKAPIGECIKVNWDASINKKDERVGIGVVVRDGRGEVMVSLCYSNEGCCSPVVAELRALWRAMKLCAELNFENVIFEGDALVVVNAVNSEKESWEWYGQMVEDMKGVLKIRQRWKVQHVFRECNQVAHLLVKVSFTFNEEQIWMECCPPEVQSVVTQEYLYMSDS